MSMHLIVYLFVVAIFYSSVYANNNWPRFRGPTAMGVAEDDLRLPDRWSRTENLVWQAEVPGRLPLFGGTSSAPKSSRRANVKSAPMI